MQIACTNCNSIYSLTAGEIEGLRHSIMTCKKCNNFIKITVCPDCKSLYSISSASGASSKYKVKCDKCAKFFVVEFPVIKDAQKREPRPILPGIKKEEKKEKAETVFMTPKEFNRSIKNSTNNSVKTPVKNSTKNSPEKPGKNAKHGSSQLNHGLSVPGVKNYTLKELFSICSSAFNIKKIMVASIGIIVMFLLLFVYKNIETAVFLSKESSNSYALSFLNMLPLAMIFFIFILASTIIARITMDNIAAGAAGSNKGRSNLAVFTGKRIFPVFISNILILVLLNVVMILFGKIPVVRPIFYAILFFPLYVSSLLIFIIAGIGFWFYPPILARHKPGLISNTGNLFRFIKKQNFTLIYIIPIMIIITTLTFSAIYLVYYGSFSLTISISSSLISDDIAKLFQAVPSFLLKISNLSFFASDVNLFNSLMGELVYSHHIGGLIIGIILSLISIFLFASFISIIGTLSTHVYILLENDIDIDDRNKLRLLTILVLILLGIFIFKKIYL
ncbi:MAG: hypothetical protein GY754_06415 [bacterium]|nr:hypothetical protein [bacterium]